jgi:hypothetical protein
LGAETRKEREEQVRRVEIFHVSIMTTFTWVDAAIMVNRVGGPCWERWFKKEFFIWWTLLGVVVGVGVGGGLYNAGCSDLTIELIGTEMLHHTSLLLKK